MDNAKPTTVNDENAKKYLTAQVAILDICRKIDTLDLDWLVQQYEAVRNQKVEIDPKIKEVAEKNFAAIEALTIRLKDVQSTYREMFGEIIKGVMEKRRLGQNALSTTPKWPGFKDESETKQ